MFAYINGIKVTFNKDFDFEKTYKEYGFNVAPVSTCINNFECLFTGIKAIHFLHNCVVIKTMNVGTDDSYLTEIKEKLGALGVGITTFSPYIKDVVHPLGLVYNIFFDENCCPIKYPKK